MGPQLQRQNGLAGRLKDVNSAYRRWLYRGGRLNAWGKVVYRRPMALLGRTRLVPHLVTLEIPGRTSGRTISYPLVMADYEGEQYLACMLGREAGWVRNLRANRMRAVLRHGRRDPVTLVELDPDPVAQAPILKRYLECAPGARPHIPVDHRSPTPEFEPLIGQYPLFRVEFPPRALSSASGRP